MRAFGEFGIVIHSGGYMRLIKIIAASWLISAVAAPAPGQTKRIAVAYSAISATQSAFYLAKDANIFDKHGLFFDQVYPARSSLFPYAAIFRRRAGRCR